MATVSGTGGPINTFDPVDFGLLLNAAVGVGAATSTAFSMQHAASSSLWSFTGTGLSNYVDGFPNARSTGSIRRACGTSRAMRSVSGAWKAPSLTKNRYKPPR